MKKKLAVVLAVVLSIMIVTGTVAYAAGETTGGKMTRAQFLVQVAPLLQEIKANREQIQTLKEQLPQVREQAKLHILSLKANLGSLTDEQIQLLKTLRTQLRECKEALKNTNAEFTKESEHLRNIRRSRNYVAILTAYGNIIRIQEQRIVLLGKLIEINKQIAAV